jgi:mRNA interferase MazF
MEVPFHQSRGTKVRPAVVVLDSGDGDVVAVPVTSRPRAAEFDLALADWRGAGLNLPSTVRVHKIAVLPKANIRRAVGRVTADDLAALRSVLRGAFCPLSE